jgi:mRNA-degrading endonuclease RelE of RelBE toxin-antitoxin system
MYFRIADTFTDSLARLTGDEQKAVKTTAFDLQMNPATPGHQLKKLDKARDKNFWTVRVSADIRIIVHYINHSDVVDNPVPLVRTGELLFPDGHDRQSGVLIFPIIEVGADLNLLHPGEGEVIQYILDGVQNRGLG